MFVRIVPIVLSLMFVPCPLSAEGIASPRTKWAFQTEGPIRGGAVVSGDTVYFGSADGNLYAVDKADGRLRWSFATGGAVAGSPAVSGSTVVVAGRSDDVYALDTETGRPRWRLRMQPLVPADIEWDYFTASPVIAGDRVFIGSGDGHVYAVDLATGTVQWTFRTHDRIRAAPLVVDGTVYQPSGDDFVYALSAADGTLQWKYETEGTRLDRSQGFIRSDIFTRPTLRNGLLIVGSRDANVYAIDIATHEKRWSFRYDSTWAMSTTADADAVYVGWSTNNMICALDLETGTTRWEFKAGAHTYTTGLIVGDDTYWGSADGKLYNLDRVSGVPKWAYDVGREIYSSPVHDNGTIYVGADDGRLYAVADGVAPRKAVYQPTVIPARTSALLADAALLPYLGAHGFEQLGTTASLAAFLSARIADGTPSVVVFALSHIPPSVLGDDPSTGLLRRYLDAGGKVVWPGGVPALHGFADDDTYLGRDRTRAEKLLGMTFLAADDGGSYAARPTQMGLNWGLPRFLKNSYAVLPDESQVVPLGHDEYGRVGPWLKTFHPRAGSGFVFLRNWGFNVRARPDELATIVRVATYGLD